jgi:RNA polymerase sigma factor (TIGR02999 family)
LSALSVAVILDRMSEVSRLLSAMGQGDPQAADRLLPLVYDELRRLAAVGLAGEKPGHTLQATALVHEAYLRLIDAGSEPTWENRRHFFAAAAEAMRRILIDHSRRKKRAKRGGGWRRVELESLELPAAARGEDLLALDEALDGLAQEAPLKAELVKLRFFAGLSVEEAAGCLGISRATADRYWAYARAWLYDRVRAADR